MTNRTIRSDRQRKAHVGVAGRIVLDVGAFADLDPFIVTAQHRAEPHAGAAEQANLADQGRGISDKIIAVRGEFRALPVKFVNGHAQLLFAETLA